MAYVLDFFDGLTGVIKLMTTNKILKKLPHQELRQANAKKDELLKFLSNNGVKFAAGNMSKPYLGELSPGCNSCVDGRWSCLYVNGLCTAKCYFCPQDRNQKQERKPFVDDNLYVDNSGDYSKYLNSFNFNGISFTGGEPFLVFDQVIEYINNIRRNFDSQHHLWIYTNGDLVTEEKLVLLKEAGLDEIRFDLSARSYDLEPLEMAVNYIDTVTVEIPALVEDLPFLKSNINRWAEIGVKFLNLHQLIATEYNRDSLASRNYSSIHQELYPRYFPVLESELAALELMRHAVLTDAKISVNYCSKCYKERFQKMASRSRFAPYKKEAYEELTTTFYLREICLRGEASKLEAFRCALDIDSESECRTIHRDGAAGLAIHGKHLPDTLPGEGIESVSVNYFNVTVSGNDRSKNNNISDVFIDDSILFREDSFGYTIDDPVEFILFKALFMARESIEGVTNRLMESSQLTPADRSRVISEVNLFHHKFKDVEWLPVDFLSYV